MKLYYKPGACSLASHIILNEVGAEFALDLVDTGAKKTENGEDFYQVNPKGVVPALELNGGDVLTEGVSILQYIADQYPDAKLAPENGTLARTRLQEHLNYVSAELHKSFSPLFNPNLTDTDKENAREAVGKKFDYLSTVLTDGQDYVMTGGYSVVDAYMFVVSNWANFVGIDLKKWPKIADFVSRVAARPATQAALKAEGLLG